MDSISKNTRLYLLRIIAAMGVIVIHLTGNTSVSEITLNSISRFSVPVFVIISGYCFLPKADSFTYVIKKSCRLFLIMLLWSFVYYIYYLIEGKIDFVGIKSLIKFLVTKPNCFWYFYMAIWLYVISPALKVFFDNADKKQFLYVLGLCFIMGSVITILVRSELSSTFNIIIEKTKAAYTLGFPCLFLTGGYIFKFGIERKHRQMIYAFAMLLELAAIICNLYALNKGIYTNLLNSFYAPNAIFMGIAVFTAVFYLPANKFLDNSKVQKIIKYFSSLTLGIYIIHPIVLDFFKSTMLLNNSICLKFISIFSISMVITMGLKALPCIRKCI